MTTAELSPKQERFATEVLNQAVKRNLLRFPPDFMFQLNTSEKVEVIANCDHLSKLKFSKSLPFAFTEFGSIALANVLASPQAIEMGIYVVRAFVQLRRAAVTHVDRAQRLTDLEMKAEGLEIKTDAFAHKTRKPIPLVVGLACQGWEARQARQGQSA